jgi:hypothetical protein
MNDANSKKVHNIRTTRWRRAQVETRRLADRLGKPIDSKVIGAVAALRAFGFPTTGSCQGHLEWGKRAPWVDFSVSVNPPKRPLPQRQKNLRSQRRLLKLLDEFYQYRPTPYDVRLILTPVGIFGAFSLINQGADIQDLLPALDKSRKLKQFQMEFSLFATFLQGRYRNTVRN